MIYIHRKEDKATANILEDLWYGNIIPTEDSGGKNEHTKKLNKLMCKNQDEIAETMIDTQKELLMKYDDAVNAMYAEFEKETFIYGFRIGSRMTLEAFREDN